jgi:hypothetical protein
MAKILKTMTVREAAAIWEDPRRVHLQRWAETFSIALDEFHIGHIVTYEKNRLEEVRYSVMWTEVTSLRALLKQAGLGQEIESHYTTALDKVKLTADEMHSLTPRARAYIEYLEQEVAGLNAASERMKATLRKINWGPE